MAVLFALVIQFYLVNIRSTNAYQQFENNFLGNTAQSASSATSNSQLMKALMDNTPAISEKFTSNVPEIVLVKYNKVPSADFEDPLFEKAEVEARNVSNSSVRVFYFVYNRFMFFDLWTRVNYEVFNAVEYAYSNGIQYHGVSMDIDYCVNGFTKSPQLNKLWPSVNFILISVSFDEDSLRCGIEMTLSCYQGKMRKCQRILSLLFIKEIFYEISSPDQITNLTYYQSFLMRLGNIPQNVRVLIKEEEKPSLPRTKKIDVNNWTKIGRDLVTNLTYYGYTSYENYQENTFTGFGIDLVLPCSRPLSSFFNYSSVEVLKYSETIPDNTSFSRTKFAISFHPQFMEICGYSVFDTYDINRFIALISTKFGIIFTSTFNSQLWRWANIPEVVATFNKNKSVTSKKNNPTRTPPLQVFLEVELEDPSNGITSTDIHNLVRTVAEANQIFERTTPYIILKGTHFLDYNRDFKMSRIMYYAEKPTPDNVKWGASFNLNECTQLTERAWGIFGIYGMRKLLSFVVFRKIPSPTDIELGANGFLKYLVKTLKTCLSNIRKYAPNIGIGLLTNWPDRDLNDKINYTAFQWFWITLNDFAEDQNVTVILDSAFDEPQREETHHTGWWKIQNYRPCYGNVDEFNFLEKHSDHIQDNVSEDILFRPRSPNTLIMSTNNSIMLANKRVRLQILPEVPDSNPYGLQNLFDRKFFGVTLDVHLFDKTESRDYSKENVEFLLNLVHTRFFSIIINPVNERTIETQQSHRYIPELAARKNKQIVAKNPDRILKVLVPILASENITTLLGRFKIAKTMADDANEIFTGTVPYVLLDFSFVNIRTNESYFEVVVNETVNSNTRAGTFQMGFIFDKLMCSSDKSELSRFIWNDQKIVDKISAHVHIIFIRMEFEPFFNQTKAFEYCAEKLGVRFPRMKVGIIFDGVVKSSTESDGIEGDRKHLIKLWQDANQYSIKHNTVVFVNQAIDTKNREYGWWGTSKIENRGFIVLGDPEYRIQEKYQLVYNNNTFGHDEESKEVTSATMVTSVVACLSAFFGLALLIYKLYDIKYRRDALASLSGLSDVELLQFFAGRSRHENGDTETDFGNNDCNDRSEESHLFSAYAYDEGIEVERKAFSLEEAPKLGSGVFGQVSLGRLCLDGHERRVAVKRVNSAGRCNEGLMSLRCLLLEIKVLSYLGRHDNIVALLGAHTGNLSRGEVFVFLELCSRGSLQKHLKSLRTSVEDPYDCLDDSPSSTDVNLLAKWCLDIAKGMEFLASKHVVHADLATRNVLLDTVKKAKICDFGLSRRMLNYENYVRTHLGPIPWRWMPPESLRNKLFNEKTDVWSYGVTMWEIYTLGDQPFSGLSFTVDFAAHLEYDLRLPVPHHQKASLFGERSMYPIMQKCWETDPDKRPKFQELTSMLMGKK